MIGQRYSPQIIDWSKTVAISCLIFLSVLSLRSISAEQLPVRIYTTADGLPRDLITRIVRDSHDFLWFCTGDGLSRFNGYEFTNYGVEQGLPHPFINDLIETRRGVYWVATNGGGVAHFNPSPLRNEQSAVRNLFSVYPVGDELATNNVNVLYEGRQEELWAGTDAGLFRLDETNGQATFRRVSLNLREPDREVIVRALVEDREGSLWMSTNNGLLRRLPDGRTVRYTIQPSSVGDLVRGVDVRHGGETMGGASRRRRIDCAEAGTRLPPLPPASELLTPRPTGCATDAHSPARRVRLPLAPGGVCQFTTADGLADMVIAGISQSSDGRIWIATNGGLTEFIDGRFRSYTTALGVSNPALRTPVEDRDGNLWLGSVTGATKSPGAVSPASVRGTAWVIQASLRSLKTSVANSAR
jgi:streptogramin lyase